MTDGLSGNDLSNLAQEVLFLPVRELQASGSRDHPRPLTHADFLKALESMKKTVTEDLMKKYENFTKESGIFGWIFICSSTRSAKFCYVDLVRNIGVILLIKNCN